MAVKKLPTTISLALEVQNGVDSDGNPKYSKKSFSGVKAGLDPADILEVGIHEPVNILIHGVGNYAIPYSA